MEVGRNKFVSLTYQLRLNGADGELVEETNKENPLEFVFGAGRMIEMFETKLDGLKAGDDFNFELKSSEAYGDVNQDAIVELPKNIFEVNGSIDDEMLTVGNSVPMQDANGNRMNGMVLEVTDETVKMDFNHPLAGDDLHFSGAIIGVREATEEEIMAAAGCDTGQCGSGCSC
ncbi:FKBP-type peptidyl-prolyl cis-trans isomerase [Natronoflexus pectinivorans]|uniref:Peptidyl-prolyl cis-trans isomerase n=1 Tax=Natronoflexus pectinivorans TaxID=682526 RepID=A0A4V2RW58_9BACT|nr:peptidylprolyl isomerase [Natronoflexus pectinivorans]TCO06944.1 FKBP-type peptidyl-prolyl cis-trans isomerase SlyD [Natronoflexus pectinivorans]